MHVRERQARHGVCECVRVKGIRHIRIMAVHTVHCIKHATNQEAVAVAATPKACAKGSYRLQVSRVQVDEQNYFLVEALCVQSRVEEPQTRLIYSKLHLENKACCNLQRTNYQYFQISNGKDN